jgi:hypothetical protein
MGLENCRYSRCGRIVLQVRDQRDALNLLERPAPAPPHRNNPTYASEIGGEQAILDATWPTGAVQEFATNIPAFSLLAAC